MQQKRPYITLVNRCSPLGIVTLCPLRVVVVRLFDPDHIVYGSFDALWLSPISLMHNGRLCCAIKLNYHCNNWLTVFFVELRKSVDDVQMRGIRTILLVVPWDALSMSNLINFRKLLSLNKTDDCVLVNSGIISSNFNNNCFNPFSMYF